MPTPGELNPPEVLKRVEAVYPADAFARGEEGNVVLVVTIETDGSVGKVEVAESAGALLDGAATRAVQQWQIQWATALALLALVARLPDAEAWP